MFTVMVLLEDEFPARPAVSSSTALKKCQVNQEIMQVFVYPDDHPLRVKQAKNRFS